MMMKPLLFLSKVTFLYNVCMLLAFLMKYVDVLPGSSAKSTIIVAGFVLSVIFNVVVNIWAGMLLLQQSQANGLRPRWLFLFNAGCFILQIYLLLK